MSKTDNMIKRAIYSILLILITSLKVMGLPYCDVRKFSIIDGLAANTISDIAQTPDRLMWFSTWNGISYYDGNSFHTFRDEADDIDLLSTNRFMGIYATARNNVWCITASRRLYAYETILCTFIPEPTLKSKACLKCLYFTIIIFDLCRYLEYFSYLCTIN